MDVEGASTANGANIYQWNCVSGAENQMFEVISNNSGTIDLQVPSNI